MMRWAPIFVLVATGACVSTNLVAGEERRPPRIPFNQVDPPQGLVVITDPTTQLPMTFRVLQFEDANVEDTLTARWFVDYYRNPAIQQQAVRPSEPNSPTPNFRAGSSFTLTANMLEPDAAARPHLVEVVVTDRPFDDPGEEGRLNRTFATDSGGDGDVVSWTVQIQAAGSTKPVHSARSAGLLPVRVGAPLSGSKSPAPALLPTRVAPRARSTTQAGGDDAP